MTGGDHLTTGEDGHAASQPVPSVPHPRSSVLGRWSLVLRPPSSVVGRPSSVVILAAFGLALVALALWMASWAVISDDPGRFGTTLLGMLALYGLACGWVVWRPLPSRWALAIVFAVGLAVRLAFVGGAPSLSDDMYRYVWDGRVQAHGINPYQYVPADPALAHLRDDEIWNRVNRKGVPTIYPPVAQALFRAIYAVHPDSVTWTKLAFVLIDMLAVGALAGLLGWLGMRPERALIYAWHPWASIETAHSGHLEGVVVLLLVLALWARLVPRPLLTGVLLAATTLVKLYALVLLPALLRPERRWDLRTPLALVAALVVAYVPFLSVGWQVLGYLPGYMQEEGLASGQRYYLLVRAQRLAAGWGLDTPAWLGGWPLSAPQTYQLVVLGVMAALALWCWLRPLEAPREVATRALLLALTLLVLTTPTYPWYRLMLLAFVPFAAAPFALAALAATALAPFIYLHWWLPGQPTWPDDIVYLGSAAALAAAVAWTGGHALLRRRAVRCCESGPTPR